MKIPLAFSLKNRASSLDEDAKLLNGYVESRGDPKKGGVTTVEKRPAMDSAFELPSGTGQGIYVPNTPDGDGAPGVVIGDILTRAPTAKKKRVSFGVQPSDVALNTSISPSVTVRILNSLGQVVTSATDAVTIAMSTNPTSATLSGTLTQNAASGVATFNDLALNRSGEGFNFIATASGLNSSQSEAFSIATHLAFTTQPSTTAPNTNFTVVVKALDSANNTDTNYAGTVTLSLWSATGNGIPTGDFIVEAVAGVATFADISLSDGGVSGNADGTYSFVARADQQSFVNYYIPSLAVSNSFVVADFTHTLTAAQSLSSPFIFGFDATAGSISPTTLSGKTIAALYGDAETPTNDTIFTLGGAAVSQSFFTSLEIVGVGTVLTASATSFNGNTWTWAGTNLITTTGTFLVNIT